MKKPNRVGLNLLDEDLKILINAGAKIFPITQQDVDTNHNPNNYEYGKVGRNIYVWHENKWDYVIADDVDIKWDDVKYKPVVYPPAEHSHSELHTHPNKVLLDVLKQSDVDLWNTVSNKADKIYVDNELEKKSNSTHNHDTAYSKLDHTHNYAPEIHTHDDSYYTEAEMDIMLLNKANAVHNHDGAYYKQAEVNSKLASKSDTGHKHIESDITDLDKYTQAQVDYLLNTKSDAEHTHSQLHTHTNKQLLDKLIETEPEASYDLSNLSYIDDIKNGYTEGHAHSNFDVLQNITAAEISNWNQAVSHISDEDKHVTSADKFLWNTVSSKANIDHTHNYAPTTHNHDSRYYTEVEVDTLLSSKSDTGHTHTDKVDKTYVDTELAKKTDNTTTAYHINNSDIHVTASKKNQWDSKANVNDIPTKLSQLEIDVAVGGVTIGTVKPTDGSMWYKIIS